MTAKKLSAQQEPQSGQRTQEEFIAAYGQLCQAFGFVIQPQLGFKQQIDGSFTIAIQMNVVPLNQPN